MGKLIIFQLLASSWQQSGSSSQRSGSSSQHSESSSQDSAVSMYLRNGIFFVSIDIEVANSNNENIFAKVFFPNVSSFIVNKISTI